jgi:succinyl-diaminopimelate desuccinylase
MSATFDLACELIRRPSVTPDDGGCQQLMADRLRALGFRIEPMRFGEVDNLWARRGDAYPLFCFAGHTDVVPPGPASSWASPPFEPSVRSGELRGRGAADMKGSLAAMITATEAFCAERQAQTGSIAFLLTSDEEGPAVDGTARVIETLEARGEKIRWCLVGEPTSVDRVGDVIKNGRRGSLNGRLRVLGRQGHVAYPHLALNPLHAFAPVLAELVATEWDRGNAHFPPTTFQISNLNAGTGAENVIPGELTAWLNFRFSTEVDAPTLQRRVESLLERAGLSYKLEWRLSGNPFLTPAGELVDAARAAVRAVCGYDAKLSTSGGTSDGRFIAPTGAQVLEIGPRNATIHQVDERVGLAELDALHAIYLEVLRRLL